MEKYQIELVVNASFFAQMVWFYLAFLAKLLVYPFWIAIGIIIGITFIGSLCVKDFIPPNPYVPEIYRKLNRYLTLTAVLMLFIFIPTVIILWT